MILTTENISEWKKELDKEMYLQTEYPNYSSTQDDEHWLEVYEGEEVQAAIDDEISCWTL